MSIKRLNRRQFLRRLSALGLTATGRGAAKRLRSQADAD